MFLLFSVFISVGAAEFYSHRKGVSLLVQIVLEKPESYHQMAAKRSPTENVKGNITNVP